MRILANLLFLSLIATLQAHEPPNLPLPPTPDMMSIVSAQAVTQHGKVFLFATNTKPVMATEAYTYSEQVPVTVEALDGQGNKVIKTEMRTVTKQGIRTITKYVSELKQFPVSGNDNLILTDATGRKLSDAEVMTKLAKPSFVIEFKGKPHAEFLKLMKPETVVVQWKTQQSAPAVPQPAGPAVMPVVPQPVKPETALATEKDLLDRTNAERKKAGVPSLVVDPLLQRAARQHATNMARQDKLAHTLDDKGVAERLTELGYRWSGCGENIAQGQRTPAHTIETWLNSEGHRENMLSVKFSRIGVAVVTAADGQHYWTMVLTQPR
ncbi:MAG: CAP domain-containing protein [Gemmatales bacterium]